MNRKGNSREEITTITTTEIRTTTSNKPLTEVGTPPLGEKKGLDFLDLGKGIEILASVDLFSSDGEEWDDEEDDDRMRTGDAWYHNHAGKDEGPSSNPYLDSFRIRETGSASPTTFQGIDRYLTGMDQRMMEHEYDISQIICKDHEPKSSTRSEAPSHTKNPKPSSLLPCTGSSLPSFPPSIPRSFSAFSSSFAFPSPHSFPFDDPVPPTFPWVSETFPMGKGPDDDSDTIHNSTSLSDHPCASPDPMTASPVPKPATTIPSSLPIPQVPSLPSSPPSSVIIPLGGIGSPNPGDIDAPTDDITMTHREEEDEEKERDSKEEGESENGKGSPLIDWYRSHGSRSYNIVVVDPPWRYDNSSIRGSAESKYRTMSLEELAKLPIPDICDTDCILFLWCTGPMLDQGISLLSSWGFTFLNVVTWVKCNSNGRPAMSMGSYFRGGAEFALMGKRGSPLSLMRLDPGRSRSTMAIIEEEEKGERNRYPDEDLHEKKGDEEAKGKQKDDQKKDGNDGNRQGEKGKRKQEQSASKKGGKVEDGSERRKTSEGANDERGYEVRYHEAKVDHEGKGSETGFPNVLYDRRREHSEKPASFLDMIHKAIGRYPCCTIFERRRCFGWDCFGDQLDHRPDIVMTVRGREDDSAVKRAQDELISRLRHLRDAKRSDPRYGSVEGSRPQSASESGRSELLRRSEEVSGTEEAEKIRTLEPSRVTSETHHRGRLSSRGSGKRKRRQTEGNERNRNTPSEGYPLEHPSPEAKQQKITKYLRKRSPQVSSSSSSSSSPKKRRLESRGIERKETGAAKRSEREEGEQEDEEEEESDELYRNANPYIREAMKEASKRVSPSVMLMRRSWMRSRKDEGEVGEGGGAI